MMPKFRACRCNLSSMSPPRTFSRPVFSISTSSPYYIQNQPPSHRLQTRPITNATAPSHIPSLLSLPRTAPKPGGWSPTLFHSSGEVKFTVIRLAPGSGEVPSHFHSKVWDYFIPLEGTAIIETRTKDGLREDFEMRAGGFLAVGPGDVHRVRNTSEEGEFVFLIAQAPRRGYDYVPEEEGGYVFGG